MRIQMQSRGLELTPRLRAYADRRTRFTLSRFDDRVGTVVIRMADLNGPRGGLDQRCQLELTLRNGDHWIVEATDFLIEVALGRALRRAARRLRHSDARTRDLRLRRATVEKSRQHAATASWETQEDLAGVA